MRNRYSDLEVHLDPSVTY